MTLLRLEVAPGAVRGLVDGDCALERPTAAHESAWPAFLEAAAAVVRGLPQPPTALEVAGGADTLAVWDEETLGSVRPVAFAVDDVAAALRDLEAAEPHTWAHLQDGRYVVGGVASYLVARVTRGVHHVTDPAWAAGGFPGPAFPVTALPAVTDAPVGPTDPATFLGLALPVRVASLT